MIALRTKLPSLRIAVNAFRSYAIEADPPKYWHAKFPDKQPRPFAEMPTVIEPKFNPRKSHEIYPRWFKEHGYIVRQLVGENVYIVHTCHFEDFDTIHKDDVQHFRRTSTPPQRDSHMVLKKYRENNKDLYDCIGLGPGAGDFVPRIRTLIRNGMSTHIDEKLEKVADDLMELLQDKVGAGGEIELLPWLFRWGFENVGVKFLDKRLGSLAGNEEADKMVEAAAVINEMVALTTQDPNTDEQERYKKVEVYEGYFYSIVKKYIDEVASDPNSKSAVKKILESNPKDAITATLDAFLGALQTVPLTALMALFNLAKHPDIQLEAREEIMEYMPSKDVKYCDNRDIPEIVEYILWETLRLNPPIIGSGRIIKSDMVLGGYLVPKETNVILHVQVANLLEEFYEDAMKFNPYRFQVLTYDRVQKIFSVGSWRSCIGIRFATDTLTLILLKMLRNFEISYDGGEISMINRLHNEPEHPVVFKLKPLSK